jgi:hypothetical protein
VARRRRAATSRHGRRLHLFATKARGDYGYVPSIARGSFVFASRTNLHRIGVFSDWTGLSSGLSGPKTAYARRLVARAAVDDVRFVPLVRPHAISGARESFAGPSLGSAARDRELDDKGGPKTTFEVTALSRDAAGRRSTRTGRDSSISTRTATSRATIDLPLTLFLAGSR